MISKKGVTQILLILSLIGGILLFFVIQKNINENFVKEILIPLTIPAFISGFIGLTIQKDSIYYKIHKDLILAGIFSLTSFILGIVFLYDSSILIKSLLPILFISTIIYFLIILIISLLWIEQIPSR